MQLEKRPDLFNIWSDYWNYDVHSRKSFSVNYFYIRGLCLLACLDFISFYGPLKGGTFHTALLLRKIRKSVHWSFLLSKIYDLCVPFKGLYEINCVQCACQRTNKRHLFYTISFPCWQWKIVDCIHFWSKMLLLIGKEILLFRFPFSIQENWIWNEW